MKRAAGVVGNRARRGGLAFRAGMEPRAGFTLVEMVFVIGIIVLLVGLTLTVGLTVRRKSEIRSTEHMLLLANMAMEEWTKISERQLTWGVDGLPAPPNGMPKPTYDINSTVYGLSGTTLNQTKLCSIVLTTLIKNPEVAKILSQIETAYYGKDLGQNPKLVDPWDNRIRVIFPGRPWQTSVDAGQVRDADGTIRTPEENRYGICTQGRICFFSFGPDGKDGDWQLGVANPQNRNASLLKIAADNIYSYPVLTENPS